MWQSPNYSGCPFGPPSFEGGPKGGGSLPQFVYFYVPPRDTLLKYADSFYAEKTPQLLAMVDYLSSSQRKLPCPPMEIAEEFEMLLRMDESIQAAVDEGQRLGKFQ